VGYMVDTMAVRQVSLQLQLYFQSPFQEHNSIITVQNV